MVRLFPNPIFFLFLCSSRLSRCSSCFPQKDNNADLEKSNSRQEENQYLANELERVKRLPVHLQKFMGWELSLPFMGWVGLDDPICLLSGEESKVVGYF